MWCNGLCEQQCVLHDACGTGGGNMKCSAVSLSAVQAVRAYLHTYICTYIRILCAMHYMYIHTYMCVWRSGMMAE